MNAVDYIQPFDKKRCAGSGESARPDQVGVKIKFDTGPHAGRRSRRPPKFSSRPQAEACWPIPRTLLRTIDDGVITVVTSGHAGMEGQSNCRTLEELNENLTPICSGGLTGRFCEHPPHPRSGALVQKLVSTPHGRQEANGNPRQPRANPPSAGTLQSLGKILKEKWGGLEWKYCPPPGEEIFDGGWASRTVRGQLVQVLFSRDTELFEVCIAASHSFQAQASRRSSWTGHDATGLV